MKRNRAAPWRCAALALATACFAGGDSWAAAPAESGQLGGTNSVAPTEERSPDVQAIAFLQRVGRYDEAEARCLRILEQRPDDQTFKRLLAQIQDERRLRNSSGDLSHDLGGVVIGEMNVHEARLADVIDFLRAESETLTTNKATINVVWEAPEDSKDTKITLSLRAVPLAVALKYATEMAGLRYRIDRYAVVIYKPMPAGTKESSPSNVKSP
jgi:hypothetical protein